MPLSIRPCRKKSGRTCKRGQPHALGGEWFTKSTASLQSVQDYVQSRQLADAHTSEVEMAAKTMNVGKRTIERAKKVRTMDRDEICLPLR